MNKNKKKFKNTDFFDLSIMISIIPLAINKHHKKLINNCELKNNMKYKDGSKYAVKVVDNHGNPLAGQRVKITVSKKSYYKTTDNNGMAYLNINLKPGKYSIVSEFGEHKVTSKITISK